MFDLRPGRWPAGAGATELALEPRLLPERVRSRTVVLRDAVNRRLLAVADVLALLGALLVTVTVTDQPGLRPAILAAIPVVIVIGKLSGLYDRDELRINKTTLEDAPVLFNAAVLYTLLLWLLEGALVEGRIGREEALVFLASVFVLGLGMRRAARLIAQRVSPAERCLLLGDRVAAAQLVRKLARVGNVALVGHVELDGGGPSANGGNGDAHTGHDVHAGYGNGIHLGNGNGHVGNGSGAGWTREDLSRLIAELDAHRVIVAPSGVGGDEVLDVIGTVKECGAAVSVLPRLFDVVGSSVEFDRVEGLTLLGVQKFGLSRSSQIVKRTLDIAGSALGLVLLSPLLAAIALAIKLDSRGPVLFRQIRVGREGRRFQMLKFRTMVEDAEERKLELVDLNEADGLFKIAADPRLTRVGKQLRKMSLDELPQLWNVLRAEMSLVGPRPLVVDEDERVVGRHRRRLQLKPGMTGQWQVLGTSELPLTEMLTIDYLYAANWSLWDDVKILLRTVGHVLARRGV